MTQLQFLSDLGNDAVFFACAGPAGRALMVMSSGFWLVTLAQVLRHPFGLSTADSAAFGWFQAAAGTVAIAGICWIASVLIRVQWRGRRQRREYFEDSGAGNA